MRYQVRLWCRDCQGDSYGCFDGDSELLETNEYPYTTALFDSKEVAEDAGFKEIGDCGPWEFEVEEYETGLNVGT